MPTVGYKSMAYQLTINGKLRSVDAPAEMPLLWALRNELGLVGTKFGCGAGLCGACTVHVNGEAQRSCQLAIGEVGKAKITTIEGVGATAVGAKLQKSWTEIDVPQCGYCQAGQIMSAAALLKTTPKPSRDQITSGMSGNLCRCATYDRIAKAIEIAAGTRSAANA